MSDHLFEQEQVERIKKFLRAYSKPILIGLAVGLIILLGYGFYQERQAAHLAKASAAYEKLLREVGDDNHDVIVKEAQSLIETYRNTPYAIQAAMILARQQIYEGDYDGAIERLQWVMKNAHLSAMKQSARLRLARVYLAKQNYPEALDTLKTIDDAVYQMAIEEVKGDILLAQGNKEGAREAYRQALNELSHADFSYPLLQMKYDDLNGRDKALERQMAEQS